MKYTFLRLLTLLLTIGFLSACNFNKIDKKDIIEEELSPGAEGIQKKYRKDKTLISAIEYKGNKRHGISRSYYEDGKTIHNEIRYSEGSKEGITNSYYPNGQLYYTVEYKEGKREGLLTKYYRTGELMAEVPYLRGEAQPGLKEFTKEGVLKKLYPKIIFEEIDKTAFENRYIVKISLSGKKKNVKFFRILYDQYGNELGEKRLVDNNGVTEEIFYIRSGGSINEKLTIKAVYATKSRNPYVIFKSKQIKVDW